MSDMTPTPQFEEEIRAAVAAPLAREEFIKSLHGQIMQQAATRSKPTRPIFLRPAWVVACILVMILVSILAIGPQRVVAAMRDPSPEAGGGGDKLAAAGVRFEHGLMESEARELNIGFVSRVTRGRPWVRMKLAATLDGRTALANGRSQWITGAAARADGHRWRARACAVLTGIGTVKADDPRLTVREIETPRQPLKVVVDSRLETPPGANILQGGSTLIFFGDTSNKPPRGVEAIAMPNAKGKVDLAAMLEELARRGVNELHVEAGFKLNGSLVREGCVDEMLVYLAPAFLGDSAQGMLDLAPMSSLDQRLRVSLRSVERVGEDLRIIARV